MGPDYCPIGGQPCQSVCVEPCSVKKRHISYACPICAASMLEDDTALLRQALGALGFSVPVREEHIPSHEAAIAALRERLEGEA